MFLSVCALIAESRAGRPAYGEKRARIYRAVHVKGAFTVEDIVKLTEADPAYISQIIRQLVADGHVEKVGSMPGKGAAGAYRVRHRDRFYKEKVRG